MNGWESLGFGGASGFIASILTMLGWNRRLVKLEDNMQPIKTCETIHEGLESRIESMKDRQKEISEDVKYLKSRLDDLFSEMLKIKRRVNGE